MPVPTKLKDRYEIKEVLGKGGMGVVYKAYDTVVKREVALKTILDIADRKALESFHKEYEVLASMSHPNIIEIFDLGEFEEAGESLPYFVMPLLNGMTLDKLIRTSSHRLTVERSVEVMAQTCRGLQAAHERGLVHRDLKPSNIFVMEDDSVKIIDFGVVHKAGADSTRGLKGTLPYMSPELIEAKTPSALSDIFSLGVVAYETFTQRRPFDRAAPHEIIQAILHHIPPPASDLNPAVSQTVSRVIHKAMAKQPYHRFSTARELAETLQKALRNEPIEFFDPARIQPRIQRATKAFEQGDYQFADEILTELGAEGHIDPAISLLRRQVDQAIRQKRIGQLLESARTRFEEEEYPLALQRVQDALELDPDNAVARGLKSDIDNKRNEGKIEDWFRLARQHIDNHAYSHARQALQNVLQLNAKESRAVRLLAEVDRQEEEYLRMRQEKEQLYQAAQEAWQKGEVSSALLKLERAMELDRSAPDSSAPERSAAYQNFYKQVRSEHDAINNSYAEARKYLADRNFAKAIALCDEYLAKYPGLALFQAMKFDVEEQQRQELSAYIAEIDRLVEAEPDLGKRVNILKEALNRYPGEGHFERSLRLMREKRDLVNSIVAKAQLHEERGQFIEALGQWEILQTIYRQYPGLNIEIERVIKRRDQQARAEAKAHVVEQIDRQLHLGDYARAFDLLQKAQAEFPSDTELAELEKLGRQGMERTAEALRLFEQGQNLCAQRRFEEGVEILRKAHHLDEPNPAIRAVLVDALLVQAQALLDTNWRSAELLIQQALDLDPGHALGKSLRTLAQDRKREESLDLCVSQARQLQAAGDLEGALKQLEQGLSSYPHEPRLAQLHSTLNKELLESQRRETLRRDREEIRRLGREAETDTNPTAVKSILQDAQTIARQYAEDAELQSVVTGIERRLAGMGALVKDEPEKKTEVYPIAPPPSPGQETVILPGAPLLPKSPPAAAKPPVTPPPPSASAIAARPKRPVVVEAPRGELGEPAAGEVKPGKPGRWLLVGAVGLAAVVLIGVGVFVVSRFKRGTPFVARVPLEVRTSPPGATILINDKVYGTSNRRLELPASTYRLGLQLEGYQPFATTVTLTPDSPASINRALQPLPQSVRLYTDLEAGKVWLDEQAVGDLQEGQFTLDGVNPGKHTLKVSARHGEATIAFEASPGDVPQINGPVTAKDLRAVLVSSLGSRARVLCSFGPVEVRLDGQTVGEVGVNGMELNNLAYGAHELILVEEKAQRKMVIEIGLAPALTAFLSSDRNVGTLVVVTGEDNVHVFLDGKEYRRTTQRGQLRIANLDVKEYVVRVFKDGYQNTAQKAAEIRKGEETKLEFKLVSVPTMASLLIQGALPGVQVILDRNPLGTVQPDGTFSASNLAPGDHTIELRKEQFKHKRITKRFEAGEAVQLGGGEVALETAMGTLRLNLSPADTQVTLSRAGETEAHTVNETTLNLPEGSYTLMARAPHYTPHSVTVQVAAGETKAVDLLLSQEKVAAMAEWEKPGGWVRDGKWFVHRGGNFVLFGITPTAGRFVFTAMVRKGRRLQWVVDQTDDKNYVLFQMDKRFFYRNQVRRGVTTTLAKIPHGMDKQNFYTVQLKVTPNSIVHEAYDGKNWVPLDTWGEAGHSFVNGRFGFLIPGSDEVALSNFDFSPQ